LQVEGGSASQNGHAGSTGLFAISHGTKRYKCDSFAYYTSEVIMNFIHVDERRLGSGHKCDSFAYYTSEVIMNFIHVDERRLGSGHTRYGKCVVNQ
jgi:hypothetical protein